MRVPTRAQRMRTYLVQAHALLQQARDLAARAHAQHREGGRRRGERRHSPCSSPQQVRWRNGGRQHAVPKLAQAVARAGDEEGVRRRVLARRLRARARRGREWDGAGAHTHTHRTQVHDHSGRLHRRPKAMILSAPKWARLSLSIVGLRVPSPSILSLLSASLSLSLVSSRQRGATAQTAASKNMRMAARFALVSRIPSAAQHERLTTHTVEHFTAWQNERRWRACASVVQLEAKARVQILGGQGLQLRCHMRTRAHSHTRCSAAQLNGGQRTYDQT